MKSTETYEHTINGLLQKRHELMQEMAAIREQIATLANDVKAIDHVLGRLGYEGKEVEINVNPPRLVLFYRGQLQQFLLDELREHGEATTRDLAMRIIRLEGRDVQDRRMVHSFISRIGKALQRLHNLNAASFTRGQNRASNVWRVAP